MESRELLVPDYMEPIVGWRYWTVLADDTLLSRSLVWKPLEKKVAIHTEPYWPYYYGSNVLDRTGKEGQSCKPLCTECGIYAFKTREQLLEYVNYRFDKHIICIGQVYLWGEVAEHENGYRAEFAYPKCLYSLNEEHKRVADKYKIPFELEKSCSLVKKYAEYTSSPLVIPSHKQRTFLSGGRMKSIAIDSLTNLPWKSQYLSNPVTDPWNIVKPVKIVLKQKTFNIHKPSGWWRDSSSGLWMRTL